MSAANERDPPEEEDEEEALDDSDVELVDDVDGQLTPEEIADIEAGNFSKEVRLDRSLVPPPRQSSDPPPVDDEPVPDTFPPPPPHEMPFIPDDIEGHLAHWFETRVRHSDPPPPAPPQSPPAPVADEDDEDDDFYSKYEKKD